MQSLKQFFSYMNEVSFPYVVLRNFDNLPYDYVLGEHSDLDLLVYDLDHWKELFPKAKPEFPFPRVRMQLPIDDSYLYCDVRYVGDNYYPEDFQRAILETREWNSRGFYTPDALHHTIALAYHAVHHKARIAPEYRRWLGGANIDQLLDALQKSNVGWVEPRDKTVGKFFGYWKGCTSIVEKKDGKVYKSQNNYKGYDLLSNEYKILSKLDSEHFPKAFSLNGKLEIEDCGKPLADNIPDNWMEQMAEISNDLERFGVQHRDIRLDNFMVKDGIIKLIDFGWAKFLEDVEDKEPPSCLGYPNKPSWGFDDGYSLRSVCKQLDYILEERETVS